MNNVYAATTYCEKQFFKLARHDANMPDSVCCAKILFDSSLDVDKLKKAILNVYSEYRGFHYAFHIHNKEIVKEYGFKQLNIEMCNLSTELLEKYENDFFTTPVNVSSTTEPLCYFSIVELSNGEFCLLIKASHIVTDAFSFKKFVDNIGIVYSGHKATKFNSELSEDEYNDSRDFWLHRLCDAESYLSITPQHAGQSIDNFESKKFSFDREIVKVIIRDIKKMGISPMIYISWAFSLAVGRNFHQTKIGFVHPVSLHKGGISDSCKVNQLPVHIDFDKEATISEQLLVLKNNIKENLGNKYYPFDEIVRIINTNISSGGVVPYSLAINPTILEYKLNSFEGVSAISFSCNKQTIRPLTMNYDQITNTTFTIFHNTSYYSADIINNIILDFEDIFLNAHKYLDQNISSSLYNIDFLKLCQSGTNRDISFRFFDIIKDVSSSKSAAAAIVDKDSIITYSRLMSEVNILSSEIMSRYGELILKASAEKTILVGIYLDKSYAQILAVLTCINLNIGYLPLDKKHPKSRVNDIISVAHPLFILTDDNEFQKVHGTIGSINIKNLDYKNAITGSYQTLPYDSSRTVYVIPTSGSTGKPKIIYMSYRGLNNMVLSLHDYFEFQSNDCMLNYSSLTFDTSGCELFPSLMSGISVCIPADDYKKDLHSLMSLINKRHVSYAMLTPSLVWLMRPDDISKIKNIVLMGEKFDASLVRKITQNGSICHNLYGPSETNACTVTKLTQDDQVHLGNSFYNTTHSVLDPFGIPVRPTSPGELAIAGEGLSDGYLNGDSRDFVELAFLKDRSQAYLSKDLVFFDSDKKLVYIDRMNSEVKINGFRVDTKEIESAIQSIQNGILCAVLLCKKDSATVIRAFVSEDYEGTKYEIKQHLNNLLPHYMIPHQFIITDIPLNNNKKIDYKALNGYVYNEEVNTVPYLDVKNLSDIERNLLDLWRDILKCNITSLDANFFDLGGDSLSAINLSIALSDMYSLQIGASFIYTCPTINLQAEMLGMQKYNPEIRTSFLAKAKTALNLFVIHPTAAGSEIYYKLAGYFNNHVNLIGVNSYNMNNPDNPIFNLEELAKIYGDYIIEHQAEGPYYLSGWSSGGNFAYAIASYLTSLNKEVEKIFMIDSFNFSSSLRGLIKPTCSSESDDLYDSYIAEHVLNKNIAERHLDKIKRVAALEKSSIIQRISDYSNDILSCGIVLFKALKTRDFKIFKINQDSDCKNNQTILNDLKHNGWDEVQSEVKCIIINDDHVGLVNNHESMKIISDNIIAFIKLI